MNISALAFCFYRTTRALCRWTPLGKQRELGEGRAPAGLQTPCLVPGFELKMGGPVKPRKGQKQTPHGLASVPERFSLVGTEVTGLSPCPREHLSAAPNHKGPLRPPLFLR